MSDARPFSRVERATVSERVRDDIYRRIVSGEIRPGARLPAERLLAEQFGVARSSVREAVQGLIALGVVERRGNRAFAAERVSGPDLASGDERRKALREISEARRVLELLLFELASTRATARERTRVLELARLPAPTTPEEFLVADREFHATIAGACGNPVLVEVYGRVLDAHAGGDAAAGLVLGIEPGAEPGEAITAAAAEHLRIAEAYAAGDVPSMLEAVDAHLGRAALRFGRARLGPGKTSEQERATSRTVGM